MGVAVQREEFRSWVAYHAELFGLGEADVKTMLAWYVVMLSSGYEADDLRAASDLLARQPDRMAKEAGKAAYLGKHMMLLAALHACVRESRAVEYRREAGQVEDLGTCTLCGSSGMVRVPLVTREMGGRWEAMKAGAYGATYYTCAVACTCRLGRWKYDRSDPEKRPLRLEDYERRNPRWREQLDLRKRAAVAEAELRPQTADDLKFDHVIARIASRYRAY